MEEDVEVWADFLTIGLRPKSIFEIPTIKHEIEGFDVWTQGSQLFSDEYLVSCIQLLGRVRGGVEGGVLEWLLPTVDLLCFVNRKKI